MFCSIRIKRELAIMLISVFCLLLSIAVQLCCFGLSDTVSARSGVPLPVLMYHSVCYNKAVSEYIIIPEVFEQDMLYIKENGYTSVSASQVIDYVYNNVALPEKPVLITLDDGQLNNYTYVLSILEKYDMKAVISIVGAYSEKCTVRKDDNPLYSYLSWEQIKMFYDSGRIEIGNHTFNMHDLSPRKGCTQLKNESDSDYISALTDDLTSLQNILKEKVGVTPYVFAYPYGFISENSKPVIKEMGFKVAFTCREKMNYLLPNDSEKLMELGRFNRPSGVSTSDFMKSCNID